MQCRSQGRMWDQGSKEWDLGSQPRDQGLQAVRSGSEALLRGILGESEAKLEINF